MSLFSRLGFPDDLLSRAVLVCVASFTVIFNASGTLFAFGVFQDLYETLSYQPDTPFTGTSPAAIGLIGTLAVRAYSLCGVLGLT